MNKKIIKILKNPLLLFEVLGHKELLNWINDEKYLKILYKIKIGKKLNLHNPQTFNEKMQWLKLHDHNNLYTLMADKFEAKQIVEEKIGKNYIIPTYGVYNSFDEIDFSTFPNEFVIKCTHNSGGLVIVTNKSNLDLKKSRKIINRCMKNNFFYGQREWPYKNIKPRIIVEKYIKDDLIDDLTDYKFMCFNGKVKYIYVTVKNDNIFENYYDLNFKPVNINHNFPRSSIEFKKPKKLKKMIEIAEKLSKGIPFLRVDLHYVNEKILFGEMTFYDWGGTRKFLSENIDINFGKMIDLSNINYRR